MTDERTVADVCQIIQRAYGDASQTVLDRECALAIIRHLREEGWSPPETVAAIVAAAGGRVEVSDDLLAEDHDLLASRTFDPPAMVLQSRTAARPVST